jgi:hypothetical protein
LTFYIYDFVCVGFLIRNLINSFLAHETLDYDLLSIIEFVPLKKRDNTYDCLDSLSGNVIRIPLPDNRNDDPWYVAIYNVHIIH